MRKKVKEKVRVTVSLDAENVEWLKKKLDQNQIGSISHGIDMHLTNARLSEK